MENSSGNLPLEESKSQQDGDLIVLLTPKGSDKIGELQSILSVQTSTTGREATATNPQRTNKINLCSFQDLLHSHLTPRENLELMAALYGENDLSLSEDRLKRGGLTEELHREKLYNLPRFHRLVLQWVIALLPDPDILFLHNLAGGLSGPAKHDLYRLILAEQATHPRTIFYVTRNIETARQLGSQIWLVKNGVIQRKWKASEFPLALESSSMFAIELDSPGAANRFQAEIRKIGFVKHAHLLDPRTVAVLAVNRKDAIVPLTFRAGLALTGFKTLSLEIDHLSVEEYLGDAHESPDTKFIEDEPHHIEKPRLNSDQKIRGIFQLALSEWRRHFRNFWKAGNIILSGIVLLSALELMSPAFENLNLFLRWAPFYLALSSTIGLGFGMESLSRLTATGNMETLFQPAQPRGPAFPLSPLALIDLTNITRLELLWGWAIGQFGILLAHSLPHILYAYAVILMFSQVPWLLGVSFVCWFLSAITTMALTVLSSGIIRNPKWRAWPGWILWLPLVLSSQLYRLDSPISWFWPLAGYSAAFERLMDPRQVVQSMGFAFLGTCLLCLWAARSFRSRSAIWRGHP